MQRVLVTVPTTQQARFPLSLTSSKPPFPSLGPVVGRCGGAHSLLMSGVRVWWGAIRAAGGELQSEAWEGPGAPSHLTACSFLSSCSRSCGQRNRCALPYGSPVILKPAWSSTCVARARRSGEGFSVALEAPSPREERGG